MGAVCFTLFDPFFLFVAVIAISLGYSKKYIIPLTALFVGLLAETLAAEANQFRQWGESVHVFLGAGIIQAILAYFAVGYWRRKKLCSRDASCG
ncbi:hypothetical protein [Endozoicomonas elysicola]|uniref:Uncharacterized protein n=1 Tax=Endozoicomonas elysicola TaxID=305900 RepID=A0A081K8Y5_9GAMM|nr:hypothetical protein [Endozoicomonas elysicola]KEI70611.1 hypothetical protein GV64_07535 [Endozoicomonas elysicola]